MVEASVVVAQFLNGLSQMMLLVLIASGLSIVWGLMDVLNFAHGAFYMLGAYTGLTVLLATGQFFVAMAAAFVIVGLLGALIEYVSLRPLYDRDPVFHLLITFGYLIVIEEGARLIWGSEFRSLDAPAALQGSVRMLGVTYPVYRLSIVLIGVVFSVAIYYFFNNTNIGLIIRAGEHNSETVRALGINLPRIFTLTFAIGIGMAALSGVVAAPLGGVQPNMGTNIIIDAFVVVIIGGVGDYRGVIVGSFLVAEIRSMGALVLPRFTPVFLLLVLLVFPVVGPLFLSEFYVFLMTEALIFAVFALGFDFLFGYTGVISFGHAAFFGSSAYAGGLLLAQVTDSAIAVLAVGILAATVYAAFVSFFALRSAGIYFALVTFAFAQILYEIVIRTREVTGGFSGLAGLPDVYLLGIELDKLPIYYLVLGFTLVAYLAARRIIASPMGLTFRCIGENDQRVAFIGYDMKRYKQIAFVLSGIYAGVAGGLFLIHQNFVGPNSLFWLLSGEVIVMTMFGGMGTLVGPMIGAVAFVYLGEVLSLFLEQWRLVFGFLFVFVVLFYPEGLVGVVDRGTLSEARARLRRTVGADEDE